MNYKKIRGESTAACMRKLRQAYGDDVVIMSTNRVREGGVFGTRFLSQPLIEIEYMLLEQKPSRKTIQKSLENIGERKKSPAIQRLAKKLALLDQEDASSQSPARPNTSTPPVSHAQPLAGTTTPAEQAALNRLLEGKDPLPKEPGPEEPLSASLPDLRALSQQGALSGQGYEPEPAMSHAPKQPSAQNRHFRKIRELLLQSQMSPEYVDTFLVDLDHNLSPAKRQDYSSVLAAAKSLLVSRIQVSRSLVPPSGEVRAGVLLGPTGSGKTTALAKIAAKYYAECEISVYGIDHYRLAATEQLKAYAEIMGFSFHAPRNLDELRESIQRDGADLLLVDVSGVGYRDRQALERLSEWMDVICHEIRTERLLCLAANTSPSLLEKMCSAYENVGFEKILLTKLDESEFVGSFIEIADKFNKPFSYICDGQVVPNDLRDAEPDELVELVFEGSLLFVNA